MNFLLAHYEKQRKVYAGAFPVGHPNLIARDELDRKTSTLNEILEQVFLETTERDAGNGKI